MQGEDEHMLRLSSFRFKLTRESKAFLLEIKALLNKILSQKAHEVKLCRQQLDEIAQFLVFASRIADAPPEERYNDEPQRSHSARRRTSPHSAAPRIQSGGTTPSAHQRAASEPLHSGPLRHPPVSIHYPQQPQNRPQQQLPQSQSPQTYRPPHARRDSAESAPQWGETGIGQKRHYPQAQHRGDGRRGSEGRGNTRWH